MTTSSQLTITIPTMRYDITLPLLEGRVQIPGVELVPVRMPSMILSEDSPYRDGSYCVGDLNICFITAAIEAGWDVVALPVFNKRKPVYEYIFCRTDRGIETPRDLEGKRIAGRQYRMSTSIWLRGFLQHRHGVDISKCRYVVWTDEIFPLYKTVGTIEKFGNPQKTPPQALLDGDVDVLMADVSDQDLFYELEHNPNVKRLFPNYREEDERLYRETGIHATAHLIIMSRKLANQHLDLPRKLYDAYEQSKALAYRDVLSTQRGFSIMYLRERFVEQQQGIWGDPFKHGIKANKGELDTFIQYSVEQGVMAKPMPYDQLFAAGTLDT